MTRLGKLLSERREVARLRDQRIKRAEAELLRAARKFGTDLDNDNGGAGANQRALTDAALALARAEREGR